MSIDFENQLWVIDDDWGAEKARQSEIERGNLICPNSGDISDAKCQFWAAIPGDSPFPQSLVGHIPTPTIHFPTDIHFAPDWIRISNGALFVSARLRTAFDLPDWTVDYIPVDFVEGSDAARAQEYCYLHLRNFAAAIDYDRSTYNSQMMNSAKTDEPFLFVTDMGAIEIKPHFVAPCDMFRDSITSTQALVTDALAKRVLDAGCTGMWFLHPRFKRDEAFKIIRTRDGMARIDWDDDTRTYTLDPVTAADVEARTKAKPFGIGPWDPQRVVN